jgi:hypothetical protein
MTTDAETLVRRAYHAAEGNVMDVQGFTGLFTADGVINMGHAGQDLSGIGDETYRGEQLGDIVLRVARLLPDIHRELHCVNVLAMSSPSSCRFRAPFSGHWKPRRASSSRRERRSVRLLPTSGTSAMGRSSGSTATSC